MSAQASAVSVQLPTGRPPGFLPDPSDPAGARQSSASTPELLSLPGSLSWGRPSHLTAESGSHLLLLLSPPVVKTRGQRYFQTALLHPDCCRTGLTLCHLQPGCLSLPPPRAPGLSLHTNWLFFPNNQRDIPIASIGLCLILPCFKSSSAIELSVLVGMFQTCAAQHGHPTCLRST